MNKIINRTLLLALVAAIWAVTGLAQAAGKDPGGFLGLKWLQTVSQCKQQGLCDDEALFVKDQLQSETVYQGTPSMIEGVHLSSSSFAFYENHFYLGTGVFDPQNGSFEKLKASLTKRYGKPRWQNGKGASWVIGKTKILLSRGEAKGGVVYTHAPTFSVVAKAKKTSAAATSPVAPVPSTK